MNSNASEDFYPQIGYNAMLKQYQGTLGTFVGPTKILISSDTLQVRDYSRYNWTMFDPEAKKTRHEEIFPLDKQKAFRWAQSWSVLTDNQKAQNWMIMSDSELLFMV